MMFEGGILSPQCRPRPHTAHLSRRFRRLTALAGLLTLASSLLAAAAPAASAATGAAHAKKTDGWIQLTHLSPNTPPVDVYLYSFGHAKAMLVLKHVAYGTVSPFEKLTSGEYTVAMRGAGAKPGSRRSCPPPSTSPRAAPIRSPGWGRPRRCGCRCCATG